MRPMPARGSLPCRRWSNERRKQLDHCRRARRAAGARDLGGRSDHGLPDGDGCGRRAECLCPQDARDCPDAGAGGGCAAGGGRGPGDLWHPPRHQGPVLHKGRGQSGRVEHPARVPARIRKHRDAATVRRGCGDAGQAEHGRIRHGVQQRDLVLRKRREPMAAGGRRDGADARWVIRRVGGGGGGGPLPWRAWYRYRWVDPPACGLHRHHRDQADLWPGQPVGHRGLCFQPRSGGADDQVGARCRDPAGGDGRA